MSSMIHALLDVTFPHGLHPGDTSADNRKIVARDGRDRLVLRGTTLAGIIRHAWRRRVTAAASDKERLQLFGGSNDGVTTASPTFQAKPLRSSLEFEDSVIRAGEPKVRIHNMIDRHTKVVIDKALHEIQWIAPGAQCRVSVWLKAPNHSKAMTTVANVAGLLDGCTIGGMANRGIGSVRVTTRLHRSYDLSCLEHYGAMLFNRGVDHNFDVTHLEGYESFAPAALESDELVIEATVTIPRGQDLLIGGGQPISDASVGHAICQQFLLDTNGRPTHVLVPGSSIRQPFRHWCKRLAAREGQAISDSHERRLNGPIKADEIAWGFIDPQDRTAAKKPYKQIACPVDQLFGTLANRGRIWIDDLIAPVNLAHHIQDRKHVSVDAITGVSRESALFSNNVVVSPSDHPLHFPLRLRVRNPVPHELTWIRACILAMHQGLIRIGNGKASGRLEVVSGSLKANGQGSGDFAKALTGIAATWRKF